MAIFDAAPMNLISDFTGSDENPLSEGGNWANLNSSGSALQRVSNAVVSTIAGAGRSYWTPANFGPDLEAYVTIVSAGSNNGIAFRIQGEGGANTWDGYEVTGGTTSVNIFVVTNGSATTLISTTAVGGYASGDKIGVRAEGSTIQAWRQASGSGDWTLMAMVGNATYPSAGKIALRSQSTTNSLDDFYAGIINAVPVA